MGAAVEATVDRGAAAAAAGLLPAGLQAEATAKVAAAAIGVATGETGMIVKSFSGLSNAISLIYFRIRLNLDTGSEKTRFKQIQHLGVIIDIVFQLVKVLVLQT